MLRVRADSGPRAPEDLPVICTEEEPYHAWWSPAPSTVDDRAHEQACRAAGLLVAQLTGADGTVGRAELGAPRLVLRESTAAPRGRPRQLAAG